MKKINEDYTITVIVKFNLRSVAPLVHRNIICSFHIRGRRDPTRGAKKHVAIIDAF